MARINAQSRLGDYFVAFKLATRKQVETCQKNLVAGQMIGHGLAKAGIVRAEMCERVALARRLYQATALKLQQQGISIVLDEKTFVGDILVALGSITPEQKVQWLQYQEAERAKGNNPGRLGELLVDRGVCTEEQRDLAMRVQDWLRGVK